MYNMKERKRKSRMVYLYGVVMTALASTFWGCSADREYALEATGAVPAAKGEVVVSQDNLGDTTLNIEAHDFADPKLESGKTYFIAWVKSGETTVKLGALNITDAGGELIATTTFKRFRILITSEASSEVSHPVNVPILTSKPITVVTE